MANLLEFGCNDPMALSTGRLPSEISCGGCHRSGVACCLNFQPVVWLGILGRATL